MKKIDIACIIDDDPIYVFGAKKMMKVNGFCNTVLVYNNGQEGIAGFGEIIKLKGDLPEIILLDLNMPIMDGWQFLDEFSKFKLEKKITIFVVSSSIDSRDLEKAKTYKNVSDFMVKPISAGSLKEMLGEYDAS